MKNVLFILWKKPYGVFGPPNTTAVRVAGREALLFSFREITRDSSSTKGSWLCLQQAFTMVMHMSKPM